MAADRTRGGVIESCPEGVPRRVLRVIHQSGGAVSDLAIARADGSLRLLLSKLSRIDLLVIADWGMAPLSGPERRDFWEICEGQ